MTSPFEGVWHICESDGYLFPPNCNLGIKASGAFYALGVSVDRDPGEAVEVRRGNGAAYMTLVADGREFPLFDPQLGLTGSGLALTYNLPGHAHLVDGKLNYSGLKDNGYLMEIDVCRIEPIDQSWPVQRLFGIVLKGDFSGKLPPMGRPEVGGWGSDKEDGQLPDWVKTPSKGGQGPHG